MNSVTNRYATLAILSSILVAAVTAVGSSSQQPNYPTSQPVATQLDDDGLSEQQREFWRHLQSLCGKAFAGRVVVDTTDNPDFADKEMVMHVRICEDDRILVPFHVGENRSRTWVITKTGSGLRLKHDHRHEDGTEEELTQYGGDTRDDGTENRQRFHADQQTAEMLPVAATNIWTFEIHTNQTFAYELVREGTDRRFRVEFDLTRPVDAPPAPWGHE